jgi:hypothetical protein
MGGEAVFHSFELDHEVAGRFSAFSPITGRKLRIRTIAPNGPPMLDSRAMCALIGKRFDITGSLALTDLLALTLLLRR